MADPQLRDCPRCGAALRFADDDGTRECVCGWSARTSAAAEARAADADGQDAPEPR